MRGRAVLVAEAEEASRAALVSLCQESGWRVLESSNGDEACDALQSMPIDALITDYDMRRSDGLGLICYARDQRPETLRLLCTAGSNIDVAVQAISDGTAHRFLLKSWDQPYLRQSIRLAVETLCESLRSAAASASMRAISTSARMVRQGPVNPGRPAARISPAHIMVADEDPEVRRTLYDALSTQGFRVSLARDGASAVDLVTASPPDCAFVDLDLPTLNGIEVLRLVRAAQGGTAAAFALSRSGSADAYTFAFEHGADGVITKPIVLAELLRRVEGFEAVRRAYWEMLRASERAERLRLYASESGALLAHDLNNGLATSIMNVQLLLGDKDTTRDPNAAAAAESTLRSLKKMAALVRNFADIYRLEDASFQPHLARVDLGPMLRRIVALHEPTLRDKEAALQAEVDDGLIVKTDAALLERVAHNVLGNAMRYVNRGGTVRVCARGSETSGGRRVVIDIGNTGTPIEPSIAAGLFEKYGAARRKSQSVGQGLYFCRLACEAMGVAINLAPVPGVATNIRIRLPLAR